MSASIVLIVIASERLRRTGRAILHHSRGRMREHRSSLRIISDSLRLLGIYPPSGFSISLLSWVILLRPWNVIHAHDKTLARIVLTFIRHKREMNEFLRSANSGVHRNYFRILAIGCVDIFIGIPIGLFYLLSGVLLFGPITFYDGWKETHTPWEPDPIPFTEWVGDLGDYITAIYCGARAPVIGGPIFVLFGLTAESRAIYVLWLRNALVFLRFRKVDRDNLDPPSVTFGYTHRHTQTSTTEGHSLRSVIPDNRYRYY